MGDVSDRRAKRGQRASFLRGVLDGWKSVASSSSQDSPSHSTSCGQLGSQQSGDDVPSTATSVISSIDQVPTIDDLEAASSTSHCHASLKLDLSSDEVKMRMTPSPALGTGCLVTDSPGSSASGGYALVKPGFLFTPTAIAYDPVQRVYAFGNQSGYIRWMSIYSKNSDIDCHARHPSGSAVLRLQFILNEGTLISVTSDDLIHLWNWKLKTPEIVQSLKFQREHVTFCHLPFQSKWLYIGTDKGNVHIANIESFALSGYVINWNKAIDSANWNKAHPGSIVHLSECPIDPNKLLIAFDSGLITLWDLRNRSADFRTTYHEPINSLSWHHEGRQFMVSHTDGSLTTWEIKSVKPSSVQYPHARTITEDLKIEPCRPIPRIEWKTCKSEDSYIIFSGGLPIGSSTSTGLSTLTSDASGANQQQQQLLLQPQPQPQQQQQQQQLQVQQQQSQQQQQQQQTPTQQQPQQPQPSNPATPTHSVPTQSLSIIHGKTTVLEMKSAIVDFVTLCETPYECDFNEPFAVLVLLSNDLMIVDLTGKKSESSDDLSLSDGPRYKVSCILPESEPDQPASLFVSKEMPEPPKQGFFKGLFSGGPSILDREELFSEQASGKGSKTIAKAIPGSNFDQAKAQTGSLQAELMKARQGLTERGENLERLEDRTARMANEAEGFREMSHQLLNKYKEKKWYQF